MPRKRKGPKREPTDADPTPASTSNHVLSHPAAATVAAASVASTTNRQHNAEPACTLNHDQRAVAHSNKRARHLAEAEQDRLGKLVGLERWLESVGHGRGAAVCVCGEVLQATPATSSPPGNTFLLELSCFHPDDPARRSNLSVTFQGQLARNVSEPLLLLHRLGPPTVVYLSGFAADLLPPHQRAPRVLFPYQNAVLKMSSQPPSNHPTAPTSAIWIEQLAAHPLLSSLAPSHPGTALAQPAPIPQPQTSNALVNPLDPPPPSQLSDWFSTPAPTADAPLPPHAPRASATSPATRPATSIVKSEAQAPSSASAPHLDRPPSRQASAAPSEPRRNAPHVKPRRMGNCLYTPMSMVRDGERASIIGVVVAAGDPRRSSSGTRDLSLKITIADASCLSGTGYAKQLDRSMTVMLFAQQTERIPQNVVPGHIVAVRSVQIQMFGGKPQAVGKSAASWSWATYNPVSGDVRASSNFPLASQTPPECSPEEMEHFRDMANWFSELQGVDANIVTRSARPTLKLHDIGENNFFDTVVEVLKVYTHTLAPDLYVSDYTNHALFYRGNDKYLRLQTDLPYPDDTDGWGHVFQISLWDSHATIAEGLQTGDIIRIQNVRPKLNPRGLLTGGLGSSTDSGIKIRTLKPTDEARIDLEKRRARFFETIVTAEEEAFADQVEREMCQTTELQPNHHTDPPTLRGEHQPRAAQTSVETQSRSVASVPQELAAQIQVGPVSIGHAQTVEPEGAGRGAAPTVSAEAADGPAADLNGRLQAAAPAVEASPLSATQPPFPTPAQRQVRTMQEVTPSKTRDPTMALAASNSSNRDPTDISVVETPDLKPHTLMGPPGGVMEERRALIRCNAPASIALTALAELSTTSLCPGMYKVKARVISTNPSKVEQWGRMECKACKRMVPHDQRFCTKCGDEDGDSLTYCLRFAIMLEEVDADYIARKQHHRNHHNGSASETSLRKVTIPLLFHGRTAEVLLPCVDAKAVFNGERSSIKALRRFHNRLLSPQEYGTDPEQVFAIHSFWSDEAGRKVRRFAALKELNILRNPRDLL